MNIWGDRVGGLDELTKDGRISVVEVEVEHEGAALHLFEDVFEHWSIHAKPAARELRDPAEITEHD